MAHGIIEESKNWLGYFYNNGEWIDNPKIKYGGKELSKGSLKFLNEFFHLLIDGTIINNCTLIWLTSNAKSIKNAVDHYNSTVDEQDKLNFNTAASKIQYDKKRLEKYFSATDIVNIIAYPEKYLADANEKIIELKRKYFKDSEYNNSMVIKIPKDKICLDIEKTEWEKLKNLIDTYSKKRITMINYGEDKSLSDSMIGYYNYLISSNSLNELEKSRLEEIRIILGLEE